MAKILERSAAAVADPDRARLHDGGAARRTASTCSRSAEDYRCTPQSVASHTLYKNADTVRTQGTTSHVADDDNIKTRIRNTVGERSYEIVTRVYGRDGVMGTLEPRRAAASVATRPSFSRLPLVAPDTVHRRNTTLSGSIHRVLQNGVRNPEEIAFP